MNCPRCGASLTQAVVDGIALDRCASCGGIWLDHAQLERVLTRESRALRELLLHDGPHVADDAVQLLCPRCRAPLIRMHASPEPVVYYACLSCYARWLDGPELERVVGRPLAAKFEKLFQMLLG